MTTAGELWIRCMARVGPLELDVQLNTAPGTLVVVGPNGAGKSSLLELVLGARRVDRGNIRIGEDVLLDTTSGVDVALEHRRMAYVPQDYALFPHLNARENVAFAIASAPGRINRAERSRRADAILHDLGIEQLADRRPQTLSGGEKQRVALARALSVKPRALLLDEPLAALDVHSRHELRRFLAGYLKRAALPTLLVTHDATDARELGDRVAVLEAGTVTQVASWAELGRCPASRFVEEFVASEGR